MESLFIVMAVAGMVELLKRLKAKDWFAAATIVLAGVIGALAGVFHAPGVADAWVGTIAGLSASGLITTGSKIASQISANAVAPSKKK